MPNKFSFKDWIFPVFFIIFGLLISLGPLLLFKTCAYCCCLDEVPVCHYAARAELGTGIIIVVLGICFFVFPDPKTRLGLTVGIFFSGIIALLIPHLLIGGCDEKTMTCHMVTYPILTLISVLVLVLSVLAMIFLDRRTREIN